MNGEPVIIERRDGVVTVTVNRPEKKNAANGAVWDGLLDVFRSLGDDPDARVLVVTGAGGDFCSGADISDPDGILRASGHPLSRMRNLGEVTLALHRLAIPTIAKVRGIAAGAGMGLALVCDLVVASETARFSEIFARRGLSLDFGASWILPRVVGLQRAKELAFFADIIDAPAACDLGLVNRVVDDGELDDFVDDWARRLAAGPPIALSIIKTQLNASFSLSMDQAVEAEARSQCVNLATEDVAEAMRAFREKREPAYRGR